MQKHKFMIIIYRGSTKTISIVSDEAIADVRIFNSITKEFISLKPGSGSPGGEGNYIVDGEDTKNLTPGLYSMEVYGVNTETIGNLPNCFKLVDSSMSYEK